MYHLRRSVIVLVVVVASWFALSALHTYLDPNTRKTDEEREDARWIATSKHWLDRQSCRWIGICGIAHWHPDPATRPWNKPKNQVREQNTLLEDGDEEKPPIWEDIPGTGERMRPGDWEGDTRVLKEVPQFVLDHAPLIHLYSGEQFWPSDIEEHLMNTTPYANHSSLHLNDSQHTVWNLHELNEGRRPRYLFMHSKDDVEDRPDWLGSAYNKPVPYDDEFEDPEDPKDPKELKTSYNEFTAGKIPAKEDEEEWWDASSTSAPSPAPKIAIPKSSSYSKKKGGPSFRQSELRRRLDPQMPKPGGYSPAPAILVLVDKGNGILDAFWFYFYSFNLGTTVLNIRFGNHIGDWEHSLIRFHHGVPKAVFFSAHSGGLAYSYDAVEKGKGKGREGRPILYSALGSHAMYATPGKHPYILPFGILADVTDKGPLWDPSLNYLGYHFNTNITHDVDAESIRPRPNASNSQVSTFTEQQADILQPVANNPKAPMGWYWFGGRWGDKFYELGDKRQWRFVGQYHYVNGPLGPRFKNLGRAKVCQSRGGCRIVDTLDNDDGNSWIGRRRR